MPTLTTVDLHTCEPAFGSSTLSEVLRCRARHQLDPSAYTFLTDGEEAQVITHRDLDRRARTIAAMLQELGASRERVVPLKKTFARSELELELVEGEQALLGEFQYNIALFDEPMIARLATHFESLLESFVADPGQRLSALPMLSAAERQQLLFDWVRDAQFSAQPESINNLFDQQAQTPPDKVLAFYNEDSSPFSELQERASGSARLLLELKNN
jgi:non-ribosomal peptide synthetase component F